jgi:hypothetical protein
VRGAVAVTPTAVIGSSLFSTPTSALPSLATVHLDTDPSERSQLACASRDRVARLLAKDMTGKHAGRMHGVPPTYNWAKHPRVGQGNHPGHYTAISAWGQVYEWIEGSPARNVRVACRDISLWILSRRSGKWQRHNASKPVNGANYVEDFVGNAQTPAPLRHEPDGSVSSTLGGGWNFHLYSTRERTLIDPNDIACVVSLYSARVIMDDPNGPDERSKARYLASAGADYWLDSRVGAETGVTNDDVGIGKARFLKPYYQTVTMSTLPYHRLAKNPPPVCLRGR